MAFLGFNVYFSEIIDNKVITHEQVIEVESLYDHLVDVWKVNHLLGYE